MKQRHYIDIMTDRKAKYSIHDTFASNNYLSVERLPFRLPLSLPLFVEIDHQSHDDGDDDKDDDNDDGGNGPG